MGEVALQRRHMGARQPMILIEKVVGFRSVAINALIDAGRAPCGRVD